MPLKIYNWLTRKKETFKPLMEGRTGLYVCEPTFYNHTHSGHAKAYLPFDILHRYLEHTGYKVRYVRNIIDVGELTEETGNGEDKIISKVRLEQLKPMEIVEIYSRSFFQDMNNLNILPADISPRASAYIPEQIELAQILIKKGHAYESKGSVFFKSKRVA